MKISKENLLWFGRALDYDGIRYFNYSSSGFAFVFKGKKAVAKILSDALSWTNENKAVLGVYIFEGNDLSWKSFSTEPARRIILSKPENECVLFESETEKTVTIRVIKLSEAAFGYAGLQELSIDGELLSSAESCSANPAAKIEFIGDSITCGYGIEGVWSEDTHFSTQTERADKSYAFLTAKKLNAEFQCCSWSGIGIISNYVDPLTENLPDTKLLMPAVWPYTDKSLSIRLGLEPELWEESRFSPDIVVIHLGTNDASWVRGMEERRLHFTACYAQLIESVHQRSPKAKICCCLGVMGQDLCKSVCEAVKLFKENFPSVEIKTVIFPVQKDEDGIAIDWHPSAKTHEKIANQLTEELKNW